MHVLEQKYSLGSEYNNKKIGSFSTMSCTSTYYGHICSTLEGGQVFTNDKELYEIAVSLRSHGWDRDLSDETKKEWRKKWDVNEFESLYTFYYPGFNLRSTDLQAFIGISQLEKLPRFVNIRNENFKYYNKLVKNNLLNIDNLPFDLVSNFAYPIVSKQRDLIIKELIDNQIEVRPLIAGNMANKPFWKQRYEVPSLPHCELIDKYGFYLPNNQNLTLEEITIIVNILNKYE